MNYLYFNFFKKKTTSNMDHAKKKSPSDTVLSLITVMCHGHINLAKIGLVYVTVYTQSR